MPTITCPHNGAEKTLGPHQMVSAHRSRAGVVTYYRCHCGDLVLDTPQGIRHSRPDTPAVEVRPLAAASMPTRYVDQYLRVLAEHSGELDGSPGARLILHDFITTLVKAAATESDRVTVVVPSPTDPPVTLLRALGRLAQQTAGHKVPVCSALADRLDELSHELVSRGSA